MAELYEKKPESAPGEIAGSLAQSLKDGLFTPTEKKFNALETEIMKVSQLMELKTSQLILAANEKYYHLEKELAQLKKWLRISVLLTLVGFMGLIVTLLFLFNQYS